MLASRACAQWSCGEFLPRCAFRTKGTFDDVEEALFQVYQPPPPPPPDDPPLLELAPPSELLEPGAETPAAMPAAAAAHIPVAPAPPDNPPPPLNPVAVVAPLGEVCVALLLDVKESAVVGALWLDQWSTCLPSPKASIHGYQLSRRFGRGLVSSFLKKVRQATSRLRKAIASAFCCDFMLLIDEYETQSAHEAMAAIAVHGSPIIPAANQRKAAATKLMENAGIISSAAACIPQSMRALNTQPGIRPNVARITTANVPANKPTIITGSEIAVEMRNARPATNNAIPGRNPTRALPEGSISLTCLSSSGWITLAWSKPSFL
jgi:hypothetical protein